MSSEGSGIHLLLPDWPSSSGQGGGQWTPDGKFFVFYSYDLSVPGLGVDMMPPSQLWALDERRSLLRRAQTDPIQLTSGPIRWIPPIISSKDGKRIFARGLTMDGQLERFDAQSHQFQPFLGGISAEFVSFSPDGQFVAYVTYPDGILWSANRGGSNRMQLSNPPLYSVKPRWSPDGTQILFMATDLNGNWKTFLVSSRRGAPQPLLPEDKGQQTDPNWSPEGRRIVFAMGTEDGKKSDIRILDLSSHQVTTLPGSDGLFSPRWSPDGRFIAALEDVAWVGGMTLKIFDFETRRWSLLHKGMTLYPAFSRDGRFIFFLGNGGVSRISTSGGEAEPVVDLTGFRWRGVLGDWMGLDPTDAPMMLRDIGSDDIYALTLETK